MTLPKHIEMFPSAKTLLERKAKRTNATAPIDRQGMIDALLQDDVRIITEDLKDNDTNYLKFLLEGRRPYSEWTNSEVEESYNEMESNK